MEKSALVGLLALSCMACSRPASNSAETPPFVGDDKSLDGDTGTGSTGLPASREGGQGDPSSNGGGSGESGSCPGCESAGVGSSGSATGAGGNGEEGSAGFELDGSDNEFVNVDDDGALVLDRQQSGAPAFIWIANTSEGTVSRIDTDTFTELGRYRVGSRDPSRTSVSVSGDAYVGSRDGRGVTKVSALGDACPDTNGDGVITTSHGPGELLDHGRDDCVLWYTELDGDIRGVAAQDILGEVTIEPDGLVNRAPDARYVWAGGLHGSLYKLHGDTGEILIKTRSPRDIYGMALDGSGTLWLTAGGTGGGLAAVDTNRCVDTPSCDVPVCVEEACDVTGCPTTCDGEIKRDYELSGDPLAGVTLPLPPPPTGRGSDAQDSYGITVDCKQRVWLGGLGREIKRFDPRAPDDQRLRIAGSDSHGVHGIAADAAGFVWGAVPDQAVVRMNAESFEVLRITDLDAKGIAVDRSGQIWGITQGSSAHVIQPGPDLADNVLIADAVTGLVSPYTYSDMTGQQQILAANEPGYFRMPFAGCADGDTSWQRLEWDADVPPGTSVLFRIRSSESREELADQPWVQVAHAPADSSPLDIEGLLRGAGQEDGAWIEVEVRLVAPPADADATGCVSEPFASPRVRGFAVTRSCGVPIL